MVKTQIEPLSKTQRSMIYTSVSDFAVSDILNFENTMIYMY